LAPRKCDASSSVAAKVLATTGPTPGTLHRHCTTASGRDARQLVEEKMLERQHQPVVVHYDDQPAVA
jgi:hypothetical protein